MRRAKQTILAFGLFLSVAVPAASADDAVLKWTVQNNYPGPLQLGFYARDRGVGWQYPLSEDEQRVFRLQCVVDEPVCLGAWPEGEVRVHWGVGSGGFSCTDCCAICGGKAPREWRLSDPSSQYDVQLLAYADCNARKSADYAGQDVDAETLAKATEIACGEEKLQLADAIARVSGVAESVSIVDNLEQLAVQNNAERIATFKGGK